MTSQTSKTESETVSTGRDFKDGDRVWVKDKGQWGAITFAGGWAALVLMDDGTTCRASYTHLSRLTPPTHTGVPDDSASATEGHTEPASTIPQTLGSEQQTSGAGYWDGEYAKLLERSQISWRGKTSEVDMVNSPPHYQANPAGIEVIQVTEHLNFCLGNAVKYILRADHKGDAEKDLRKAIWYLERELQRRAAPASVEVTPDEEEQAK